MSEFIDIDPIDEDAYKSFIKIFSPKKKKENIPRESTDDKFSKEKKKKKFVDMIEYHDSIDESIGDYIQFFDKTAKQQQYNTRFKEIINNAGDDPKKINEVLKSYYGLLTHYVNTEGVLNKSEIFEQLKKNYKRVAKSFRIIFNNIEKLDSLNDKDFKNFSKAVKKIELFNNLLVKSKIEKIKSDDLLTKGKLSFNTLLKEINPIKNNLERIINKSKQIREKLVKKDIEIKSKDIEIINAEKKIKLQQDIITKANKDIEKKENEIKNLDKNIKELEKDRKKNVFQIQQLKKEKELLLDLINRIKKERDTLQKEINENNKKLVVVKTEIDNQNKNLNILHDKKLQVLKGGQRVHLTGDVNNLIDNVTGRLIGTGRETTKTIVQRNIENINADVSLSPQERKEKLALVKAQDPDNIEKLLIAKNATRNLAIGGASIATGGGLVGATALVPYIPKIIKNVGNVVAPKKKTKNDLIEQNQSGIDNNQANQNRALINALKDKVENENIRLNQSRRDNLRFFRQKRARKQKTKIGKNIILKNKIKLTNIINNRRN